MEVIENHKNLKIRITAIIVCPLLMLILIVILYYFRIFITPLCCIGIIISGFILIRYFLLVILSQRLSLCNKKEYEGLPSICFIIPCLNERSILESTVPKMRSLMYKKSLYFCYVVESVSNDGTIQYLENQAELDSRIKIIIKNTPPAGRGAAIAYGLPIVPYSNVVSFFDSDHTIDQDSLQTLSQVFNNLKNEQVVQGSLKTRDMNKNILVRAQAIERIILERLEIEASGKINGFNFYGGGQGFFSRSILDKPQFKIDESIILDDIELSFRLRMSGYKIVFNNNICTESLVPTSINDLLDQRLGWARGWLDLAEKEYFVPFKIKNIALPLRVDCIRFFTLPYIAPFFILFWSSGISAIILGASTKTLLFLPILYWPLFCGIIVSFIDCQHKNLSNRICAILSMVVIFTVEVFLFTAVFIDKYVIKNPSKYIKTKK